MTQNPTQIRRRPVIRVFVSSTFSDMKHERNALAADVYPKLEQLCQKNGFQFQAIDLRWGVSTEAGLDHRTMRICFDELRRAQEISPKPNFLILLGDRYGWRPLPEEISVKEFEEFEGIAHTESAEHAEVLRLWYLRDDNAVPPVYVLQTRRQDLHDGKDYTQDALWGGVQDVLWGILNRAVPATDMQGRFEGPLDAIPPIVRFQASATEQEIWQGALRVDDAREHVLAFFRDTKNLGEFSRQPDAIKDFVDLTVAHEFDAPLAAEQGRLKAALADRLCGGNVFRPAVPVSLTVQPDETGKPKADITTEHLGGMCADIERRLTKIIEAQISEYWRSSGNQPAERASRELEIEQQEHVRVGEERGGEKTFVGRKAELEAIRNYLTDDIRWPLVVHGASGCGKTALMARAAEEARWEERRWKKEEVIVRFIGVTPRASDLRGLLTSLCQELRQRSPRDGTLPTDIKELRDEFSQHLQAATPEQPLILFLDALDQLSDADGARLLNWIPTEPLPEHVKLVVSCLSDRAEDDLAGRPFAELTRRQLIEKNFINLDALSEIEATTLLFDRWLHQAGRTVSPEQRKRIEQRLTSPACCQPIYLKLLFEEVRLWHSYDAAPKVGENVPAILGQLIERLSKPANHGQLLVHRVLGYLAASRHGLAENEILEILFADPKYKAVLDQATELTRQELPASATRIPIAIWSRLRFDLAPYLTERAAVGANVLTFYHRQVGEWVRDRFEKSSDRGRQPHGLLADYFETVDLGPRLLVELPWQLKAAGEWTRLVSCLTERAIFLALYTAEFQYDLLDYWGSFPAGSDPSVAYCHAVERFSEIAPGAAVLCEFTHQTARFLAWMNHYAAAEELYRKAIVLAVSAHGADSPITASVQSNLAELLTRSGRHAEAGDLYRSVLQVAESHPEESRDLGISYSNQGNWYHSTGQDADAEQVVRRALEIHIASVGSDSEEAAVDRLNLARVLTEMSRADEAEPICREALAYYRHYHTPSHPEAARCLVSLGLILQKTGRAEEAQSLYLEALEALEQATNVNVDELTALRHNFAWALMLTSCRQPSSGSQP